MSTSLKQLREQRTALITKAQEEILSDRADAIANSERMLADVEKLEKQIGILERAEKLEAEERAASKPPRASVDRTIENKDEQRKAAFAKFVRFGKDELTPEERSILREQRDVTTNTTGPAFLIPQAFYGSLVEARKFVGNILSNVTQFNTGNGGAPMKYSFANDTANILTTLNEATVIGEVDPAFSGVVVGTDTVATLVKVSVQELQDSYFDLDTWLRKSFGVRYARGLDQIIVAGNGGNVQSIVSGATLGANVAAASGPLYADFNNVYGQLDYSYLPDAKWVMNPQTRAKIMGLLDGFGRPLFIPSPNSGTLDQIFGQDIVLTPNLPNAYGNASTTATATGILFGNLQQGYVFRSDGPISIVRLDERFMDSLEIGFLAYSRVGGVNTDAGTHPILSLVTPVA